MAFATVLLVASALEHPAGIAAECMQGGGPIEACSRYHGLWDLVGAFAFLGWLCGGLADVAEVRDGGAQLRKFMALFKLGTDE
jgi:hypothetical protein